MPERSGSSTNRILVIAAHPDDEVLGCGGTIARHTTENDTVHIIILAEGATSRSEKKDSKRYSKEVLKLSNSAEKSAEILGASSLHQLRLPDNRLDSLDRLDIIKPIEALIKEIRPHIIYTHHNGDLNIDHSITHDAVVTACRPIYKSSVETLLFFEIPSSTGWQTPDILPFKPDWYVDITGTFELKLKALEQYNSEMKTSPHPRSYESVKALAVWRGANAGLNIAEAFMLGRRLIR